MLEFRSTLGEYVDGIYPVIFFKRMPVIWKWSFEHHAATEVPTAEPSRNIHFQRLNISLLALYFSCNNLTYCIYFTTLTFHLNRLPTGQE